MGAVLQRRLGELVADLRVRDRETRDRVPDGLHQARVTCRRLRSALATFRPVLVREVTEPIRGDLRWLALGLGDARDAEVVHARLSRLTREEVPPADTVDVLRRIDGALESVGRAGLEKADAALATERYLALQADLDRLVADPPWAAAASRPAEQELPRRLGREQQRLDRRAARAREVRDHPAAYDDAVHEVRKAAKRLRYAWEVAEPVLGDDAGRHRLAARELTRLLGERQDIVLTRALLARLEAAAAADGEPTDAYRLLRVREEQRAAQIADDALHVLQTEL